MNTGADPQGLAVTMGPPGVHPTIFMETTSTTSVPTGVLRVDLEVGDPHGVVVEVVGSVGAHPQDLCEVDHQGGDLDPHTV